MVGLLRLLCQYVSPGEMCEDLRHPLEHLVLHEETFTGILFGTLPPFRAEAGTGVQIDELYIRESYKGSNRGTGYSVRAGNVVMVGARG